jgi:hypothetical protein
MLAVEAAVGLVLDDHALKDGRCVHSVVKITYPGTCFDITNSIFSEAYMLTPYLRV